MTPEEIIQAKLQNMEQRLCAIVNNTDLSEDSEAYLKEALTALAAARVAIEDNSPNND
jgi:hypothetical protein